MKLHRRLSQDRNGYGVFGILNQASMFGNYEQKGQVMMDHIEFQAMIKIEIFIPNARGSHWKVFKNYFHLLNITIPFEGVLKILGYCSRGFRNVTVSYNMASGHSILPRKSNQCDFKYFQKKALQVEILSFIHIYLLPCAFSLEYTATNTSHFFNQRERNEQMGDQRSS